MGWSAMITAKLPGYTIVLALAMHLPMLLYLELSSLQSCAELIMHAPRTISVRYGQLD